MSPVRRLVLATHNAHKVDRDKVVLLPCDDPEWSNFTKFFALHFVDFGLTKLISTSYAPDSNPADINYQPRRGSNPEAIPKINT